MKLRLAEALSPVLGAVFALFAGGTNGVLAAPGKHSAARRGVAHIVIILVIIIVILLILIFLSL